MGLALMVGQISAIYACICESSTRLLAYPSRFSSNRPSGSDAAAHMAEEIKDAGTTVPRAMLGSYLLNGALGIIFLISYMFVMTDVGAALEDVTGYPHIWVFSQAVSPAGVIGLNVIPTVLIFAGTLTYNLSTSRQTWAFARDDGLPFSNWIKKVDPKLNTPANSVTFTCIITIALSLINIGSDVAFNASKSDSVSLSKTDSNNAPSHLPQRRFPDDYLRLQYRLRALPPYLPPRAPPHVPLVPRQVGRSHQHWRLPVLVSRLLLVFLAQHDSHR